MLKRRYYILTLITIILTSFTVDKQTDKADFEMKVEKFINGLKPNFEESPERHLNSKHNDFTLETKTNSTWNKTLTLKSKKTFKNHYNRTVKQRLYFGFHNFETVEKCNQAFDTLMKCLGTDCQTINWGDEKTGLKTTPFIYLKTEKQIVFCKISCEYNNDFWEDVKLLLEEDFKTEKYKIITADCGTPLTFKTNEY
jgi:hypothetical protein